MTEIGGGGEGGSLQDASIVNEICQWVGGCFICIRCQPDCTRDLKTIAEPCYATLDGPRKNGRPGCGQVGQRRLQSLVPLFRWNHVLEWQPENPPPHCVIVVVDGRRMIADQPQSELGPELKTRLVQMSRTDHIAAGHLLDQSFRELLSLIHFNGRYQSGPGETGDVIGCAAVDAIFFQERREVGSGCVVCKDRLMTKMNVDLPEPPGPFTIRITCSLGSPKSV